MESLAELDHFRDYLRLLVGHQLGKYQWGQLDSSDVVQQTLLQAHQRRDQFRGSGNAELAGWLRQILANQLANQVRDLGRAKRDVHRELELQADFDASAVRLETFLAADQSSPSQRAAQNEALLRLSRALLDIPDANRQALMLRHCEGWSIDRIAEHLARTPEAVGGLLKRGLKQLRAILEDKD